MSVIDEVLAQNEEYARTHRFEKLSPRPSRRLAVLTCMDTRLERATLGLSAGESHLVRNAGGIVTSDSLRSLLVSHYLLGSQEFMVINHTDCGLLMTGEDELREKIEAASGTSAVEPAHFHAFTDIEWNVQQQLRKLKSHPWVPKTIIIRGFVYDVTTGRLREVHLP